MRTFDSLYGRLLYKKVLPDGFKQVKRAKGGSGIDWQTLSAVEVTLDGKLDGLLLELKEKRCQPRPIKRVMIPKEGGGERKIGIPT